MNSRSATLIPQMGCSNICAFGLNLSYIEVTRFYHTKFYTIIKSLYETQEYKSHYIYILKINYQKFSFLSIHLLIKRIFRIIRAYTSLLSDFRVEKNDKCEKNIL